MSFALGECDADLCTRSGMYTEDDECPGSDGEGGDNHHCVDCGALWWDDKGHSCGCCEEFWCPHWQYLTIFQLCEHKDDEEFDPAICLPCYFQNEEWHCHDPTCKKSYEVYLKKWQDHCNRLVIIGEVSMIKDEKHVTTIKVGYERQPSADTLIWPIDFSKTIVEEDKEKKVFDGLNALESSLDHVNSRIRQLMSSGYNIKNGDYGFTSMDGVVFRYRKGKKRDESPKRKTNK